MASYEDGNDGEVEQNTVFSAHLSKFSYIPPLKSAGSMQLQKQASSRSRAMRDRQAAAETEEASSSMEQSGMKKRKLNGGSDSSASRSPTPSKRRTTTKERSVNDPYEPENNLVDSLRPGMMLVFCGLK
jgi:hypothetical protein